jgi:hypothetical protein
MCRERSLDELGVHPPQPVAVLDDHRRDHRVREKAAELGTRPVHRRADLCFYPDDALAAVAAHSHSRAMWRSRSPRSSWEDTRA